MNGLAQFAPPGYFERQHAEYIRYEYAKLQDAERLARIEKKLDELLELSKKETVK